ncbi:hypothetical protein ANO11243_084800 [Dothideomycetidae sp. 11243]|nr:hypothetical protein ANO11243_084800 [fungal sp. No.11243]
MDERGEEEEEEQRKDGEDSRTFRIDLYPFPDITQPSMDFQDTSYFQTTSDSVPTLPSPTEVCRYQPDVRQGVAIIKSLGLIVKYGHRSRVKLEEAQTLRALSRAVPHELLPVPEVFGWRVQGERHFLYMSLVDGGTLRESWPTLADSERRGICGQLARVVSTLRRMTRATPEHSISRHRLHQRWRGSGCLLSRLSPARSIHYHRIIP